MRPAIITHFAKKTAAVVLSGTAVVAMGSFALASSHGEADPPVDPIEDTCDPEAEECPTEDTCDPETDECPTEDTCDPETDECPTEDTCDPEVDECPADDEEPELEGEYENHGQAVREAARETCPKGKGHGACVSAVAHSDVGKKSATEEPETLEEPESPEEPEIAEEPVAAQNSERGATGGNGRGKGASKKR